MYKISCLVTLVISILLLTSCDSNKGKVEEKTKLFIEAINGHDKATVFDLYPKARDYYVLSLPDSIQSTEISVEKTDSNKYTAILNNPSQQKIIFMVDKGGLSIIDTYSILKLDSANIELAIKTGIPVKKESDLMLGKLMDANGKYMSFLKDLYKDVINGDLTSEGGTYIASRDFYSANVSISHSIRNTGKSAIKGEEYNVEFYFYSISGSCASTKEVEPGADLEPSEAYTYALYEPGYYRIAMQHDFGWTVSFVYKNQNPLTQLLKNANLKGDEYTKFKAKKAKKSKR